MDAYAYAYYGLFAAFLAYGLYRLSRVGMRPKNYPPGPPTLPLIGNLHLIDKEDWHLQLEKWAQEYGPIYSVKYGTRDLIVLTSDVIVRDLFDKRSGIYSGRQDIYLNEIWQGLNPILRSNDDTWRMQRKLYHGMLTVKTFNKYIPYQDLENVKMLVDFIQRPEDFRYNIRRYSTSLTTTMVYGWRTPSYDVPYVKEMFEAMEEFLKLVQHSLLYDWYPILRPLTRNLPDWMVPGQTRAKYLFEMEKRVFTGCWQAAKKENENGTLVPCLSKDIISVQEKEGFSDTVAAFVAGLAFEGGSDTTAQTLYGFVKAMACFPEAHHKAQEELDRVVGSDRLPNVEDEENLPYIGSCVKEILRWMPINLTGVAHAPSQDDEYMGYKIPKGAGVIINVWAIHHDPKRHANPREYNPDRYANDHKRAYESATTADPTQRDHFGFGSGRRMCPGLNVAERSVFLGIARLLWAFNITKAKDANGHEIPIDRDAIEVSQSACPKPYKCSITPRDEKRVALINKIWAEKSQLLDENGQYKSIDNLG